MNVNKAEYTDRKNSFSSDQQHDFSDQQHDFSDQQHDFILTSL